MTVLVTGGLGAIGPWVLEALVERGIRPVAYDARLDPTLVEPFRDRIDLVQGDILDLASLLHTIRQFNVERSIHLAGILFGENNPLQGLRVNTEGPSTCSKRRAWRPCSERPSPAPRPLTARSPTPTATRPTSRGPRTTR